MFLKRLEVKGFKSFAEQVNIDFVRGVTAVVGPNGSGKSNISDSIRWVLGEQSAKSLRGSKMEDIIFAGSDSRKPVNFAEVTLVLDNTDQYLAIDYSEVSVTRRVYRSGDSDYIINKQSCRLKDIYDLFLDTGLGKEAYSIIGQGKIEEVLNSKPHERRTIFDEAAGVLKYKTRKTTAEKRLIETRENLLRVEDISHELEGQVEPLRIQASVAKEYLHIRDELKEIDIALLAYEMNELHSQWESEKEKLAHVKEQYRLFDNKLEVMEEQRLSLRNSTMLLSTTYNEVQEKLLQTSEDHERSDGQRQLLKERNKYASQNREQLENSMAEKATQLTQTTKEWQKVIKRREQAESTLKELDRLITKKIELIKRLDSISEDHIDGLKGDYIEVLNEQASVRNERRYLQEQLRQQTAKQERLLADNEGLLTNRMKLIDQLELMKTETIVMEKKWETLGEEYRSLQLKLESHKAEHEQKEKKLYDTYQLNQRLQSRADVLEGMQAEFSGFFHGVKAILKARNTLSGVHGAVIELVTVPKEYETALEIALGGTAQHIVMESEKDARLAIQFLKENNSGRATFLPLSTMKPRMISDSQMNTINNHASFVGIASHLISFDKKYERVMLHLLGQVMIAIDLRGANELAAISGRRFRIVTLEGDVVNPGGSMTGGTVGKNQTSLLGRKRELEGLNDKLSKLAGLANELENEVKRGKEKLDLELEQLATLRKRADHARDQVQEKKEIKRNLTKEIELEDVYFSRFDRDKSGMKDEIEHIHIRLSQLDASYESVVSQAEQLEQEIKLLERERNEHLHSREALQEELLTDKIALATAKERLSSTNEQAKRLGQAKSQLEEEQTELAQQYEWIVDELSNRENGENSLKKRIRNSQLRKQELTEQVEEMKQKRSKLDQSYVELERDLKIQQTEHVVLADECRQIEVKVNRLDVQLDNHLTDLREEYELTYEAANTEYELTSSPDEARKRVHLLKASIVELGTVNLGAIEEFERVRERYDFLETQRQDLDSAKATLYDVIAEMDQEMTIRFRDTFSQIRTHFQKVFKQLFGGGEADLVLTEPENILETGVEIVARPPGKKMQHLALLSGGEKTLTAIGLLFAILYVRPVPFCVLDEVEAALDEANVSRFAHFLKEFSEATQFIVITHRKGTMEEADALYGVTMQESGVSRLVSVKLEETKELIEK